MNHRIHLGRREEATELGRSHRGKVLKALVSFYFIIKISESLEGVLSSGVICLCLHLRRTILIIE